MPPVTNDAPPDHASLREIITDALRYWEPRRLVYNAVLATVVVAHFCAALPASRGSLTVDSLLSLFLLAVAANLCYCASYVADVFAQLSGFRAEWRRWRGGLLVIGLGFAGVLTRLFSLGFFALPPPR